MTTIAKEQTENNQTEYTKRQSEHKTSSAVQKH